MKVQASKAAHLDFLDGLRGLLAVFVTAHHAWATVYDLGPGKISGFYDILGFGPFCVDFFIVLSGFCLMLQVSSNFKLPKGIGVFLLRRAQRILPPYYFALVFSVFCIVFLIHDKTGTHWDLSLPISFHNVATHIFLVQNFFAADFSKINHVFWSISVEWQIYFTFPLLLLGWRLIGAINTSMIVAVSSLLIERGVSHYLRIEPKIDFIGLFGFGMLAAHIGFSNAYPGMRWSRFTLGAGFVFLLARFTRATGIQSEAFGLFASLLLVDMSRNPRHFMRVLLSRRPFVFVGTFSYSLYLIHGPLLQILWQYPLRAFRLEYNLDIALLLFPGIPIIIFAAYLFFICFERPFLRSRIAPAQVVLDTRAHV